MGVPPSVWGRGALGGQRGRVSSPESLCLFATPPPSAARPFVFVHIPSKGPNPGCHFLGTNGLEGVWCVCQNSEPTDSLPSCLPAKLLLLLPAGSSCRGTPSRRWWCSGTGRSTRRTCWATTWTAAWQAPTSGSPATTSPSATTGAAAPRPAPHRPGPESLPGNKVQKAKPTQKAHGSESSRNRGRNVSEKRAHTASVLLFIHRDVGG